MNGGTAGMQILSDGQAFANLTLSGNGSWTLGDALSSSGTLTIISGTLSPGSLALTLGGLTLNGGTLTGGAGGIDLNGNLSLSSGTFTAPSGSFTVSGDWTKTGGTFTSGSNTVTFDGAGTQTLTSGGTDTNSDFSTFTVNKSAGTLSIATNALSGAAINVTSGTFSPGSLGLTTTALTINGGTLSRGAGSLTTRTLTVSSGTYDSNSQTTTIPGLVTVSGGNYLASTALQTFNGGLTVSGGTFRGSTGNVDLNGALILSSGTLLAPTGSFTVSGDWTKTGGTFTSSGGTVTLDGSTQTLGGSSRTTFSGLRISSTSATLSADESVLSSLQIDTGATLAIASYTLSATGATILNYGTLNKGTGKVIHTSALAVGSPTYLMGSTLSFTLTDSDQNIDGTTRETLTLPLAISADDGPEVVTLTESSPHSGVFTGTIPTAHTLPIRGNGIIETKAFASFGVSGTFTDGHDTNDVSAATTTVSDGQAVTTNTTATSGGGGGGGGHRGGEGSMAALIAQAERTILERYAAGLAAAQTVAQAQTSASSSSVSRFASSSVSSSLSPADHLSRIAARRGRLVVVLDTGPVLYRDVPVDAWFAPFVSLLVEQKIAQGYTTESGKPTGEFGVANPVTRAEVLKMALDAAGKGDDLPTLAPNNRSARTTWAAGYVRRAEDLGLTVFAGNPDVNAPATRGEVVQTILETMGFPIGKTLSTFADVPADHPYSRAIALAAFDGFVEGDTAPDGTPLNRFRPDDAINRAEVAKIIALAVEVLRK